MRHKTLKNRRPGVSIACLVAALAVVTPAAVSAETQASTDERPVIGLKYEEPVKAVYQVTADVMKDGVSKGLSDLKAIYDGYVTAGVKPADITIKAVFHSKASAHLLTDEAWDKHRKTTGGNPNNALIKELVDKGIELELCDLARTGNGWSKSDIHPDVVLVGNAYHRIVELQADGYTYVKF